MFTEAYIPEYRQYIESLISEQYRILNKDDISWNTRYFANKHIDEYRRTMERLEYEEFRNLQTHTQIAQNSHFFNWIKEQNENLGS